ncbi:MAG: DUF1566 domain-containing protein [Nitrospirae bacterium]|nr:DUF1566 domain-containing protein [Nitrospirota bacterium]
MRKSILKCIFVYLFLPFSLMAFTLLVGSQPLHAELIDRGGGMIYDTDLNITWLKDANYAKISGYDADGLMTWSEAMTWADNLVYGGYSDWRLPVTLQPDPSCIWPLTSNGFNCRGSEIGHLYYTELGNLGGPGSPLPNTGPFSNIDLSYASYWSSTLWATDPYFAWNFYFGYGEQKSNDKLSNYYYAWAVRDGDVISSSTDSTPPSPVPNFSASPLSTSEIRLTWNVPFDNVGVFGYIIKKFQGTTHLDPDIIISGSHTSYKYTGLLTNTTYKFVIIAYDSAGNRSEENALLSKLNPLRIYSSSPIQSDGNGEDPRDRSYRSCACIELEIHSNRHREILQR